ncbi:MAG: putative membrane protein YkvI [Halieaceae bacterium]|jgi:uncharacterized membrane protein YkvI
MSNSLFQRVLLPGFLFQSAVIGGGYATGRELVEFFLSAGPVDGLLGIAAATVMFSIIAALSFEFARLSQSYDYRKFFQHLLGPAWFLYEIAYGALILLVLAVIGSASSELVAEHLGIHKWVGMVSLMSAVGLLVFHGTGLIEKVLAGWSFLLYGVYFIFAVIFLSRYGGDMVINLETDVARGPWLLNSLKYVGYNVGSIIVIIFCVRHMQTRSDALIAGVLAGPIAMLPALLLFCTLVASYPGVLNAAVPADYMMARLQLPFLQLIFYIVVFGTFVETGAAMLHAINERIAGAYQDTGKLMPAWLRPVVALAILIFATVLADRFGIITLIAKGYGTLTWAFVLVFLLPLLTIGGYKIFRQK